MNQENIRAELEKVRDALIEAKTFHVLRDQMNAQLHLAETRLSPLTSRLSAESARLDRVIAGLRKGDGDHDDSH